MDIRFQAGGASAWKADIMLVLACKGEDPAEVCTEIGDASPWFTISPGRRDFVAEKGKTALFYGHPKQNLSRVMAIGLGEREKCTLDIFRKAIAAAVRQCRELGLENILIPVPMLEKLPFDVAKSVEESTCGAFLGLYRFMALRTPKPEFKEDPRWLAFGFAQDSVPDMEQKAARQGEYAAQGISLARDLSNTPPNIMTPKVLGEKAEELAKKHNLNCTIFDEDALQEMGCNAMLAVGLGSKQGSRMVVLEYAPKGHENDEPVVFVGKGLTFDSGGICLKPAANMHLMKSDMSGAAAVLGALESIASMGIEKRVIGVLACAENMSGSNAMRPGDVVKSLSGKTVEILNTDAEGRLVLCDALTYAQNTWKSAFIVDIATLTGACAVALGLEISGVFSDDELLNKSIQNIGMQVGEPFWALPLWANYEEQLKSEVADISHMGGREGGAILAALYLKNFINEGVRWAHLDIAGTDWAFKKTELSPIGAVGCGVRTLIELTRSDI